MGTEVGVGDPAGGGVPHGGQGQPKPHAQPLCLDKATQAARHPCPRSSIPSTQLGTKPRPEECGLCGSSPPARSV